MKIALVHDYLLEAGGAERVLRVLADMYPDAPIYTALRKAGTASRMFEDRTIIESSWAPLLKIGRLYSYLRFALPWIWRSVNLSSYDLVITSCSGYIARGFIVGKHARVIAYCHTPPRWLYRYDTPTRAAQKWWGRAFMWVFGPFVRYFDYTSAERVNTWIANSAEVASRISKFYRQEATVVYPPVEATHNQSKSLVGRGDYYLIVSRIVGGKGILEAARAFARAKQKLIVVGETVDTKLASELTQFNPVVEHIERVVDEQLSVLYERARGFVAMSRDEDFGMTVVEAMTHGAPVLAYDGGGYRETVVPGKTGILISSLSPQVIALGITALEKQRWDPAFIKRQASKYGRARFERAIRTIVGV